MDKLFEEFNILNEYTKAIGGSISNPYLTDSYKKGILNLIKNLNALIKEHLKH